MHTHTRKFAVVFFKQSNMNTDQAGNNQTNFSSYTHIISYKLLKNVRLISRDLDFYNVLIGESKMQRSLYNMIYIQHDCGTVTKLLMILLSDEISSDFHFFYI